MDSKKSPLALLAQTCSQIGADSNSIKPSSLVTSNGGGSGSADKNKKLDTQQNKPQSINTASLTTVQTQKLDKVNDLVFKPYEANVLSRKNGDEHHHRPLSKTSSVDENLSDESNKSNANKKHDSNHSINSRVSSRNSNRESPASVNSNLNNHNNSNNNNNNSNGQEKSESNDNSEKSKSPSLSQKDSPRSSLDLLQSQKDLGIYKAGYNPFYPHGMDPTNPAFRSSFHHASMLAAAAGYPTSSPNPYLSYARIKTPTGAEALVPVCKDPYCTGCQYSAHNQQMLMGVPCPPGCTQCEQQKYGLAMAMSSLPPNHPFAQMSKPFACNWLMPDGYCGRRYSTTDELIQHMKTHSPNLSDPATAASVLAAQQQASLMPPSMFFPPGLHRAAAAAGYPPSTSPLSPLSASRYHPYAKPGAIPTSAYSSFNPALSAYYPPYSWMTSSSQRLGAAAHP